LKEISKSIDILKKIQKSKKI